MKFIFGYLDPVTGSALAQILLGAAAVIGLGYQYFRKGLRSMWARISRADATPDKESTTADA